MKDYRTIIAENLTRLRTASHLTQAELADKLSYSDKAVSKWERGESIPDVTVLKTVADLYGVTVDYLLAEHSDAEEIIIPERKMTMNQYRITWIAALGVLFLAAVIFLVSYIMKADYPAWLVFIWALPTASTTALVLSCVWSGKRAVFITVSLLIWSLSLAIFLSAIANVGGSVLWMIFIAAAVLEVVAILAYRIAASK